MTPFSIARNLCYVLLAAASTQTAFANDNLIAQKLFDTGRYAEAAEIFTDPAWKGVALFRSEQWWRAAEAFVRADDADSYYNLGNTYVKLSYYALALEAYNAASKKRDNFEDALFNAELMRKLLAQHDDEKEGQSALQRNANAIDQVDSEGEDPGTGGEPDSDESSDQEKTGEDRDGDSDSRGPNPEATSIGSSSEAGSNQTLDGSEGDEGGSVKGTESETDSQENPSGGSEGRKNDSDAQAAGTRAETEAEQATEQWLNQIQNDPQKYLQRRIELEINRRRAAGESAPQGGSTW